MVKFEILNHMVMVKFIYDIKTKKSKLVVSITAKCISKGPDSSFLVGTASKYFITNRVDTAQLIQERTISTYYDDNGNIWYGTLYGVYKIVPNVNPRSKTKPLITDRIVNDITGFENVVYVATSIGLCQIKGKEIVCIDKSDGLIANNCLKLEWHKAKLYVATSNGLSILSFDSNHMLQEITNYTEFDGLNSNDLNDIEIIDDNLYLASNKGVCKLELKSGINSYTPVTNIISARADGKGLQLNKKNELKPNTQTLEFAFSGMSFGNGGKDMSYRYKLEPIINEWLSTNNSSINFSGLDPLEYTFSVQAINNRDELSNNISTVDFEIKPTLFQSIFFKVFLGLAFLLLLRYFLKYKSDLEKKKQDNERKMSALELDAIKAQINPHFIYNCLNSIKNTIAKGENLSAEKQISIFAKLIRQTLNNSKQNFIKLEEEINYLENYLQMEKLRFKDKLEYKIVSDVDGSHPKLKIPAMLIQPYVENAVKYGMQNSKDVATKIDVRFSIQGQKLICEVEDNGPGINATLQNKKNQEKSYGMSISSTRAKTYNDIFMTNITIEAIDKSEFKNEQEGTLIKIKMDIHGE